MSILINSAWNRKLIISDEPKETEPRFIEVRIKNRVTSMVVTSNPKNYGFTKEEDDEMWISLDLALDLAEGELIREEKRKVSFKTTKWSSVVPQISSSTIKPTIRSTSESRPSQVRQSVGKPVRSFRKSPQNSTYIPSSRTDERSWRR